MTDVDFENLRFEKVVICNDLTGARQRVVLPILSQAARHGYCGQDQFALRLGLEEALSNAYRHGNARDPSKQIRVRWVINDEAAVICVSDEGNGFDPSRIDDPRKPENREKPSGRGVMLIKAYMTDVRFRGNEVRMIKKRKSGNRGPSGGA